MDLQAINQQEQEFFNEANITEETLKLAEARGWRSGIVPQRVLLKFLRTKEVYIHVTGSKNVWSYIILCNRPNYLDVEALSNFDMEFRRYNFNLRFEDPESATEDALQQALIRCTFKDDVVPE